MYRCKTNLVQFSRYSTTLLIISRNQSEINRMGVKALWTVIGSAGQPTDLRSLSGKTVAIDLAGWVVGGGRSRH